MSFEFSNRAPCNFGGRKLKRPKGDERRKKLYSAWCVIHGIELGEQTRRRPNRPEIKREETNELNHRPFKNGSSNVTKFASTASALLYSCLFSSSWPTKSISPSKRTKVKEECNCKSPFFPTLAVDIVFFSAAVAEEEKGEKILFLPRRSGQQGFYILLPLSAHAAKKKVSEQ